MSDDGGAGTGVRRFRSLEWLRRRWAALRRPEPPAGRPDATFATVHAVLAPAGLVEVAGIVEPAVWAGAGDPPPRGGRVSARYDDRARHWIASPAAEAGRTPS